MNLKNIDVVISAKHACADTLKDKTVVVVDVLRATSVMATALYNGAEKIIPVLTTDDVFDTARQIQGAIKAGERHAEKVDGFDLGNSPLQFTRDIVHNKTIVMSTTNGTNALLKTNLATITYIGAFINLSAVVNALVQCHNDIVILCAGTNGAFSMDDALCAGGIINGLKKYIQFESTDLAQAHEQLYVSQNNLHDALKNCKHYNILKNKGFTNDLNYCLGYDRFDILPVWDGKEVRI